MLFYYWGNVSEQSDSKEMTDSLLEMHFLLVFWHFFIHSMRGLEEIHVMFSIPASDQLQLNEGVECKRLLKHSASANCSCSSIQDFL